MRCDKFAFASHSHRYFEKSSHSYRIRNVKISFAFSHLSHSQNANLCEISTTIKIFWDHHRGLNFRLPFKQLKLLAVMPLWWLRVFDIIVIRLIFAYICHISRFFSSVSAACSNKYDEVFRKSSKHWIKWDFLNSQATT